MTRLHLDKTGSRPRAGEERKARKEDKKQATTVHEAQVPAGFLDGREAFAPDSASVVSEPSRRPQPKTRDQRLRSRATTAAQGCAGFGRRKKGRRAVGALSRPGGSDGKCRAFWSIPAAGFL
jgi:hypothetical protein